jgi:hypothetical protein
MFSDYASTQNIHIRKKVNIHDIYDNINEKINKKHEVYTILLEKVYKKIQIGNSRNYYNCSYEVPVFVPGYPLYDIKRCIAFIIADLRGAGFVARFEKPSKIYISWNYNELQNEKYLQESNKKLRKKNIIPKKEKMSHPFFEQQKSTDLNIPMKPNNNLQNKLSSFKSTHNAFDNGYEPSIQNNIISNNRNNNLDNSMDPSSYTNVFTTNGFNNSDLNKKMSQEIISKEYNFNQDNQNYNEILNQITSIPIHYQTTLPSPIETAKKFDFSTVNLKYDPHNIHLPTFNEVERKTGSTSNKNTQNSNKNKKQHPFDGISTKYNANGKFVLDLS